MPRAMTLEEEFFNRMMGGPAAPTVENHISGSTFCFTGALTSMTRSVAREHVTDAGGYWTESVTGATKILVAGSIPRSAIIAGEVSLKLMKARQKGVEIISEETFLQMLKDAGVY